MEGGGCSYSALEMVQDNSIANRPEFSCPGVEVQPTSPEEVEQVPLGAGVEIAAASHGLDAATAILFFQDSDISVC